MFPECSCLVSDTWSDHRRLYSEDFMAFWSLMPSFDGPHRVLYRDSSFSVPCLLRCINFLRGKAACIPPDGLISEAEEAAVSRSLELVRFLLESFQPVRAVGSLVKTLGACAVCDFRDVTCERKENMVNLLFHLSRPFI